MKAFLSGVAAVIVIAVVAAVLLDSLGMTSAGGFSTANVRL
jgi:hypothetical protein